MMTKSAIYVAGAAVLGLVCGLLEGKVEGAALFMSSVAYVILLRFVAMKFGK